MGAGEGLGDREAEALLAEGAAHHRAGRHEAAEAAARAVLARPGAPAGPVRAAARHLLAVCRAALGDLPGAAEALAALVAGVPEHDEARLQLAAVLARLGRHPDIVALLAGEVRHRPSFLAAYRPLAAALWETGAREDAIALYRGLVARVPQDGPAHAALGHALRQTKAFDAALPVLRRAVALLEPAAPGDADARRHLLAARIGLAEVLAEPGADARATEAAEMARAALGMGPAEPDSLVTLSEVLTRVGEYDVAGDCLRAALARWPHHVDARLNLALLQLLHGDFARGWAGYEMRHHRTASPAERERVVPWTAPQTLHGRRVRVLLEQGAGDTLHFARYLPLLAGRGAEVEVVVDPASPLRPLLAGMPAVARLVDPAQAAGPADAVVPLLSLPLAFGTDLAGIPAAVPYLEVPAERRARWRGRLGAGDGRPRVGVVWWGNPQYPNDRRRSLPFAAAARLLGRRDIAFHVLADRLRPEEAGEVAGLATVHEGIGDFADTAALAEAMDLVISVDTAVAHLAGALGRPVWILLPFSPDWRWMLAREDSPWYPSARLFRQAVRDDWDSVVRRVGEALDARFG